MRKIDPHTKLSVLWLFILLNIIFKDLHQFVMPGVIARLMTGEFNGVPITEELMLFGGIVVSVPIGMVPLSHLVQRRSLRPLTYCAAALTTVTMVPPQPVDLDDMYHFGLQLVAVGAIIWTVWQWREDVTAQAAASAPKAVSR
ncbi:DUF6326 family protein [Roseobacter sinensis]|uniref:DUF6326 family protein n=1 Tax=Roseobacter sinensis TaxID=2931391 RepID=A0ABT3BCZ9_9RHOB|nr:DUF6326 family protein [Roseobacter sp. WL0113]MCV3271284.1 DUF6326 family protein [Roseobacter sp. WL0113]